MRTLFYILFFCFWVCGSYGQTLTITDSATTPSVCFNDGTITVAASGGSGTYTFSIISGPSYPNITYPIPLAHLDSVFLTMPHGQYTIEVTDGSGHTAFATATVPGTYTFPVISPPPPTVVDTTCITVNTVGGLAPYQYAISSVGTNTGFGPYQSSNSFCHLCDGNYWIRVMDSCSNIYTTNRITVSITPGQFNVTYRTVGHTDSIHVQVVSNGAPPYTFHLKSGSVSITNTTGNFGIPVSCLPDTITVTDACGSVSTDIIDIHTLSVAVTSPCHSGTAILSIDSEAIGPFTITGSNGTLITHLYRINFNSLPTDSQLHFTVTDSCGNVVSQTIPCIVDTNFFYTVCPFDSSIYMESNTLPFCYPVVVTCLNCSPRQTDTVFANVPTRLFYNMDTGVRYTIRIQDSCGFNDTVRYTPHFVPLALGDSIISCRDFTVYTIPHDILTPPVLYSLFYHSALIDTSSAFQPYFYHLAAGTYTVTASQARCQNSTASIVLPGIGGACLVPMFDSACTPSYAIYQSLSTSRDIYSLVSTVTSATYRQRIPSPFPGAAIFFDVPVGSYNLVSDSGCSVPFALPAFSHTVSAISQRQCTGQALITATVTPPINSCNSAQGPYFVLLKDNQYIASNIHGQFNVMDTGYYVVRLFFSNTFDFGISVPYDTVCPLDTTLVYVDDNALPNLTSNQVILVCGHVQTDIPYTIFGGTAPYTVQILGFPTQTVTAHSDTFHNAYPGIYTMIVSDSCGISRSFSVSVIDTCSPICTVHSQMSINDSLTCQDHLVYIQNLSTGGSHYRWYINGQLYAYGGDTSFVATRGASDTIKLYAYVGICVDSSIVIFTDTCTNRCNAHSLLATNDSLTCLNNIVLIQNQSTGGSQYQWYINGQLYAYGGDTSFIAAIGRTDTIQLLASGIGCVDTFTVLFADTCTCGVHSLFSISDTLTCTHTLVSVQDQSTDATSYGWYINGHPYATHADTSFYAATAGSYTVTEYAYNSLCEDSSIRKIIVEDTIHHTAILDTSICSPISLVLNSHLPNTLWSNGTADSVTTVTGPGLYRAIASNICGTIIDSVNVSTKPAIAGFDLTDSKSSICEGDNDSSTVTASIDSGQSVVFIWSTGLRDTTIYSSHIAVYQTGTYEVTADNGFCPQMKTISITEAACDSECVHGFAIPDIFSPNNDGRNDTFLIPHLCDMTPFAMHIYNRWGQLVFESTDINVGWDGKYKGALEPEEEYWLWLMMTLPNGKHIYRSGTVTLVR